MRRHRAAPVRSTCPLASSARPSCQSGSGEERDGRRAGVVVSRGYLRLSAEMVVLTSMGAEETIMVSGVWSLLTRGPTGRTDRRTSPFMTMSGKIVCIYD